MGVDDARVQKRVRFINAAARHPFQWTPCLQRSVALRDWLAKGGVHTDLRVGVQREGDEVKAHAWLEYGGEVLNDAQGAVSTFVRLIPAGSSIEKVP